MAESRTKGFGERLRRAREEAGRDIKGLSEVTRVQGRYIVALEAEDWAVVPKGVIGRGFVRVVARELGVPSAELLQLYQAARGESDAEPDRSLPEVDWKVDLGAGRKHKPLIAAGAVLAALAVAFWLWTHRSSVNERPATPQPAAAVPAAPAAPVKEVVPPTPAPAEKPAAAAPQVPVAASPAPAKEAPTAGLPGNGALRLELEGRERVWVRVSEDGAAAREKVLKAGEKVTFQAKTGFQVKLGNAGAVKLYWNGEALKPAGKSSQVVSLSLPKDLQGLRP